MNQDKAIAANATLPMPVPYVCAEFDVDVVEAEADGAADAVLDDGLETGITEAEDVAAAVAVAIAEREPDPDADAAVVDREETPVEEATEDEAVCAALAPAPPSNSCPATMVTGIYCHASIPSSVAGLVYTAVGPSSSLPPMLVVVHVAGTVPDMTQWIENEKSSSGTSSDKSYTPVLAVAAGLAQGPTVTVSLKVPHSSSPGAQLSL